jgi:hypothetical protein
VSLLEAHLAQGDPILEAARGTWNALNETRAPETYPASPAP